MKVLAVLNERGLLSEQNEYFLPSDRIPYWMAGIKVQCLIDWEKESLPSVRSWISQPLPGSIQMTKWNV